MPSGGARARSGPPPDPNALRRERDAGEWTTLPADGRSGPAPDWPLSRAKKREQSLWEAMWRRPQAVMWERLGQEHEVAMYVRRLVEAEVPGSAVNLSTLVRQMADSLGLTTPGLRANRWRISAETAAAAQPARRAPTGGSARDRLRVLTGDDGA
jgi:hypothetical protein